MIQIILLVVGVVVLLVQQYIQPFSANTQFAVFLTGIILLGVPHGAADLLVATQNAGKKSFSKLKFFAVYLARLFLFAGILWFFPLAGNILFIFFAAYHFGETDLNKFKTNTLSGKLFVTSYGLVILSIILLNHFEDVRPIFLFFKSGTENIAVINWIDDHRYIIISLCGILFFTSTFIYFLQNNDIEQKDKGLFLVRFACILVILFNLPMVLGFTFYFIVWHSVLSLKNIVHYLRIDNANPISSIVKQISIYSFLAIAGIGFFGFGAFMYMHNNDAMAGYVFLGLAVLTAPHMEVMHNMYNRIRQMNPF